MLYTTGELIYYDSPDSHEAEDRVLMYASCTGVKTGKVSFCLSVRPSAPLPFCLSVCLSVSFVYGGA